MFQRFFDEGLAQASFLVGCDRTKQAVVIDPRRDISIYAAAASQRGATLTAAVETHVHADFVSGGSAMARNGLPVLAGPGAGLEYAHREVRDGETMSVGDMRLTFLHTPGHTPEHICILAEAPGEPVRLFTGDLLFVGGVGRPDLLGDAQTRQLAHDLFVSLRRVTALDETTEVHPGHGAGSLCGAGIGKEPSSTIGRERRQNPMLQYADDEAFVKAVLADIPGTPPYFARMKRLNAAGAPPVDMGRRLPALQPAAAAALSADGAVILDLRSASDFGAGHPYGALNIGFGAKVGYWAGWVIDADTPLILMDDDPARGQEAATQLHRVGLDRIEGMLAGGFAAWRGAGLPVSQLDQMSAADLRVARVGPDAPWLLDVRTRAEWRAGHIDGTTNIPVGELVARMEEVPRDRSIATLCEGGYRSSLAASLLEQAGVPDIINVAGGMAAYRAGEG